MKKFISMVMAAAMVVSLVPATAFAANTASFKVVDDIEWTESEAAGKTDIAGPQIQIKLGDVDTNMTDKYEKFDITLSFDNVEVKGWNEMTNWSRATVVRDQQGAVGNVISNANVLEAAEAGDDKVKLTIKENGTNFAAGDIIVIELGTGFYLTKLKEGTVGTVKIGGDFGTSDEMVVAAVVAEGIDVELDDDIVDVAEEEIATLETIVIEPNVGANFGAVLDYVYAIDGTRGGSLAKIELKLNKGFEFANQANGSDITIKFDDATPAPTPKVVVDEDVVTILTSNTGVAEITIDGLQVEATTAKAGDIAKIKVNAHDCESVSVEVAEVIDYTVVMELTDADEDVPVFYSGVNVNNDGLTVDDNHKALEVTIKESFAGAWDMDKKWNLNLPEGVYVTDVVAVDENTTIVQDVEDTFAAAYQEGDHANFEFGKRVFNELDPKANKGKNHEITFTLQLVADPDFVGDVVLTLEGDAVDTQEVTIAKFVPYATIKAEQNDLKIDYRYTEVPTAIVITEAEAGLWAEGLTVGLQVEKGGYIAFEDDATYTVNEDSDMEIDDDVKKVTGTAIGFKVDAESDEVPAEITIDGIELFMQRNIPAGAYDLEMIYNTAVAKYESQVLFAPDCQPDVDGVCARACSWDAIEEVCAANDDHECFVGNVCDYSNTVKEAWVNVVTAGREADDASFTTKVVVPVGEAYIIAGEAQVTLDVPAYVSAAGYTMLPVRAVAVALGINTQNVLWDQATKTVTILYGQRIITMQVGSKVVYVNGSAIPASASVEIVDGRTFLPMRDLATALGVTDITWDAATKTATLNGNA